jgi:hypothetical protein
MVFEQVGEEFLSALRMDLEPGRLYDQGLMSDFLWSLFYFVFAAVFFWFFAWSCGSARRVYPI